MTRAQLQTFIYKNIPLARAMGLTVASCSLSRGIEFALPLKPNRNHKNTAFGGTLVAAQAIGCWAWVLLLLRKNAIYGEIVIQRQSAEFILPVEADFKIVVAPPKKEARQIFLRTIKQHRKARLQVTSHVQFGRKKCCEFIGDYVAVRS